MALRQEECTSLSDDVDIDRDRALVERCQHGDSAAFGSLYARYNQRLLRFCLRRLNDRHEAEDAAQEAFARAWKALPNFAGERRFYPWLTVIAGNICTDMLRRRSRSTPTEDAELGAYQPLGSGNASSDEVLIASVEGELVHKALDRLSVRHRHVLAMREGSGWTYQQIADHEGVEIGTIETLLWRARQALKREFAVLSESTGARAGFLIGMGALLRKGLIRVGQRSAALQPFGGGGGLRNAFAGAAITSAAVAALVVPHVLPSSPVTHALAAPATAIISPPAPGPAPTFGSVASGIGSGGGSPSTTAVDAAPDADSSASPTAQNETSETIPMAPATAPPPTADPTQEPLEQVAAGVGGATTNSTVGKSVAGAISGVVPPIVTTTFAGVATGLVVPTLGLGETPPTVGLTPVSTSSSTTTSTTSAVSVITSTAVSALKDLPG